MKCEQAIPYLSAARDELDASIASARDEHLLGCTACSADAARFDKLRTSLASIHEREVEIPSELVAGILSRTERDRRRTVPFVPVPIEMVRALQDNRETIVGVAGAAVVAAGAAWAIWRGMRSLRRPQPQH